jgi:quercetin dioxygenase-like cupin family protein/predicted RNA-binding Zn-ribbon protein involved in translation (DUF1610 family)
MENVSIDDVEPSTFRKDIDRRGLTGPLNTANVAINRYVLEPGKRLSGLHAHMDQEEVFIVIDGTITFETMNGEIVVGAGEAIRFAPGDFQSGKNDSDSEVVAYALGVPRDSEDLRIPLECPECGHDDMHPIVTEDGEFLVCPDCGAETEAKCPECGHDSMRAILAEDRGKPISVCQDCGAEAEI